ncbi:PUA-like domain-containing protein [Suillus bovinus]|uniref:PUA-like domain-containing protein n=1 Tax=Suillus bovinus TaxID=48563 RepID=UPI001B884A7B|nr:PUA-like domain-containing protein [Suillus bovinus]KAG2157929.1 PUA-like domain-containing protein [Suillus bovinus]
MGESVCVFILVLYLAPAGFIYLCLRSQDCSNAGVHRPFMAGICGTKKTGAFSIVVSCHYKDDKDSGDTIYYTGTGGRKRWSDGFPRKRLRLGPQVFDQQWSDPGNEALVKSRDTGNPVRVVRSHKALSEFAPAEGYRYDGCPTTDTQTSKAWKEKNPQGLDICRYRLEVNLPYSVARLEMPIMSYLPPP